MYRAVGWSRPCPYPGSGAITGHRAASSIATSVAPAEMWSARFEVRLTGATRNARPASTSTPPPSADATAAMADSSTPVSSLAPSPAAPDDKRLKIGSGNDTAGAPGA